MVSALPASGPQRPTSKPRDPVFLLLLIRSCGLYVNNVGEGARYEGEYTGYTGPVIGSCDMWNNWQSWNASTKAGLNLLSLSSMDALQNWFFWTWRIGNATSGAGAPQPNPFWHYRLGWQNGWIPRDPRAATGQCARNGVAGTPFNGYTAPYMTGGAGAGTIAAAASASYPWPPTSFTDVPAASMSKIYQYTTTGTAISLPGPTFTSPGSSATIDAGSGWASQGVGQQALVPIAGLSDFILTISHSIFHRGRSNL